MLACLCISFSALISIIYILNEYTQPHGGEWHGVFTVFFNPVTRKCLWKICLVFQTLILPARLQNKCTFNISICNLVPLFVENYATGGVMIYVRFSIFLFSQLSLSLKILFILVTTILEIEEAWGRVFFFKICLCLFY